MGFRKQEEEGRIWDALNPLARMKPLFMQSPVPRHIAPRPRSLALNLLFLPLQHETPSESNMWAKVHLNLRAIIYLKHQQGLGCIYLCRKRTRETRLRLSAQWLVSPGRTTGDRPCKVGSSELEKTS